MTPVLNQMNVVGIVSIPGMMTGQILGGTDPSQAARYQMIMMFLIASSTALATIVVTVLTLNIIVDKEHRIRPDRIDTRDVIFLRWAKAGGRWCVQKTGELKDKMFPKEDNNAEQERLLG